MRWRRVSLSSVLDQKFVRLPSPVIPDVWLSPETEGIRSASLAIRDPCINRLDGRTMDPGSRPLVSGLIWREGASHASTV